MTVETARVRVAEEIGELSGEGSFTGKSHRSTSDARLPSATVLPLLRAPKTGKLPPARPRNAERRSREHLTADEVERLMTAARGLGRHGHRDATLILIAFRHGLRVSELVALRWEQVDLREGLLHVRRRKSGTESTHPLRGPEIRALRRLLHDYPDTPYVFVTERKGPLTSPLMRTDPFLLSGMDPSDAQELDPKRGQAGRGKVEPEAQGPR